MVFMGCLRVFVVDIAAAVWAVSGYVVPSGTSQEILRILCNPKVHNRIHKSRQLSLS